MKARRWVRTTVALSAALVGLIGCAAAPDSVTAAAAMPLDPYLRPADAPAPPSTPEEAAAARSVVEDAVAACMAERGFHYVPYVPPATGAEYAPASRDWSAQWGYGLVARVRPAVDSQDPNPAIRAALSASEQGGWDDAMSGAVVGEQAVPGPETVVAQAFPASGEPSVFAAPPAVDGAVPVEEPATVTVGDPPVPLATSAAEIDENGDAHEPGFDADAAAAAADQAAQAQAAAEAAEAAATQLTTEEAQSVPGTGPGLVEVTAWAYPGVEASAGTGAAVVEPGSAVVSAAVRAGDGCRQRAENAGSAWTAYTPLDGGSDPWDLRTLMSGAVLDAPEVVAARDRWSHCLAEAGHPGMTTESDPPTSVEQALTAARSTDDDGQDERLAAVQASEIALAVADHDCRVSSGLTAARDAAQRAMEQEYVDAHRSELEQWRAAINGGG